MARPPIPVPAGTRFGRLVVLRDRRGEEPTVLVTCDCGSPPKEVHLSELRRRTNPLTSCGCRREENLRLGRQGLTSLPGARNPAAKLTARQVGAIRRRLAAGESQVAVARRFGVGASQVGRIARGESWGHLS